MRYLVVLALAAACGRVNFDPLGGSSGPGDGTTGDGNGMQTGDGGVADSSTVDSLPAACANAFIAPLGPKTTKSTCATGLDQLDGCGPTGTQEIVFTYTPTISGGYTIRAYDTGTANVSVTTGIVDDACTRSVSCTGILATPLTAGQTYYWVLEESGGGCKTVDFQVTMP